MIISFPNAVTTDGGGTVTAQLTVRDATFTVTDDVDTTKAFQFQVSGLTTGTTRTLTVPDVTGTLAALNLAQMFTAVQTFSAQPVFSAVGGISLSAAVSVIVPGATSLSLRNNANSADNLLITDAGAITVRSAIGGVTTLTATTLAGTLSTAAQPNVTSVGTLTSLTIAGFVDITAGGLRVSGLATIPTAEPSGGTGAQTRFILYSGSTSTTGVLMQYFRGTTRVGYHGFSTGSGTIAGVASADADFIFATSDVVRGFIDDSDSGRLILGGGLRSGVGIGCGTTVSTNNEIFTASQGAATTTLYIGNASINVTSDVRLKKNLSDSAGTALPLLRRLRIRDFEWDDPSDTAPVNRNSRGQWQFGVVAQEAIDVVPWLVNAPDRTCSHCLAGEQCSQHDGYWNVDWGHDFGLLVKGIQELDARLSAAGIA